MITKPKPRSRRATASIWALAALALVLAWYADGPVESVFLGAAAAILEEAYVAWGPEVNLKRPRHWLVACALVSPVLPFVMLGTANVHVVVGFVLGAVVTIVGWRLCIRPAIEASELSGGVLAIPGSAALIVALAELGSQTPLASSLLLAAVLLWIAAIVALAIAQVSDRVSPMPAARIGLGAGACALLALVLAAHGLNYVDGRLSEQVRAIAARPEKPTTITMAMIRAQTNPNRRDALIARTFAPRLFLAMKTAEFPRNPLVDKLISNETEQPRKGPVLSDGCFVYGSACGRLPGSTDYPYGTFESEGKTLRPYGVVYTRIVYRGDPAFKNAGYANKHFDEPVKALVQYWLYYGYDRYEAVTPFGRLVQQHESDWEAVIVGLGSNEPLFVAYNAHCGGQWLPWKDVPAAFHSSEEGQQLTDAGYGPVAQSGEPTHPAVMVALGSQASYPASDVVRVPDWTSCTFKSTFGDAIAAAASVKEHVRVTQQVVPVQAPIASAGQEPMSFRGHWGLNNHAFCLELPFGASIGCGGDSGYGPETPPAKRDWKDPFGVIFHSATWHRGHDPAT